ncbi:hypothetical protein GLX30_22900 [Streptomyces sp. Tu 2975]|uniref:hypothetical protein n=1 Tax=Streptomyces sp. Tu 2975 TaxID=2676871 RepID=UPI0013580150|nr:hypothetical protein [Streptomyces sp. Tu 2975]QIP86401.1 hypothetical protein GLX30_22900 [Streptomyces sp. Tu 2975]
MIRVMLCGAADTRRVQDEFVRTVTAFGGVSWHFLDGTVNYINSASSDWEENSRATVQEADVCVFVIVEEIGRITWETEVTAALLAGKPFLVLCLHSTYQRYLVLDAAFRPPVGLDSLPEDNRDLVRTLREIEQERRLTAVPFDHGRFGEVLRRELSKLFDIALGQMEERNRRKSIRPLLNDPARLTTTDLRAAQAIAVDEWEDKQVRKAALRALAARRALDAEALHSLLASGEQGVQRMAVELLADLHPARPPDPELLEHVVAVANASDDVGIPRRLIPVLLAMDLPRGIEALTLLDVEDMGSKRRLAAALEAHEDAVAHGRLQAAVAALLERCLSQMSESDWKTRCRAYLARLGSEPAPPDPED